MFRQKTKNIVGLAKLLVEKHGGEVPRTLAELVKLPGVGRKTANVVLGVAFGRAGGRRRRHARAAHLAAPRLDEAHRAARDRAGLMTLFPRAEWDPLSHVLIFHGRRICFARKPACDSCPVNDVCPSAFKAEKVGRKPPRRSERTGP